MINRREIKKKARTNLKQHWVIFMIICAIASFIGAEFVGSLYLSRANDQYTLDNIVLSIMEKGVDETKKEVDNYVQNIQENEPEALGRSNGVFAFVINAVSSGSIYLVAFSALKNIFTSQSLILTIITFISLGIYSIFWFFIINIFKVITRRMFLEGRTYKKVPFRRIIFIRKTKTWKNVSFVMFVESLYEFLWNLTIIGGIIKHYSYLMVPFILAENPSIKAKECITLSRNMMNGHKWEAFKIDVSFILWKILGVITFGISTLLFSNIYEAATFTEFYTELRKLAKDTNIKNADMLNDKYLYELADKEFLKTEYKDAVEIMEQEDYIFEKKKGFKYAIFEFLGIHKYTEEEKMYEKQQLKEFVIDEFMPVINQETYPFRLFTIKTKEKKHRIESLNYLRRYSINSIIFIFFIISFIGWIWEVMLFLINQGIFVNRGTMHGPWLPIYGGGSILILLLLSKFRKNIPLQFILAIILCGFVEYLTAFYLEATHGGQKWWDYTGYFLNLHGRICAEGLLTFGFGGLAVVYFIAPALDNWLRKVNKTILTVFAAILVTIFAIDVFYSRNHPNTGKGINDFEVSITSNIHVSNLYENKEIRSIWNIKQTEK